MDAQKFLGNLANSGDVLSRAPHLLYVKRAIVGGASQITFAFTTDPKVHIEHFSSEEKCALWWSEFVSIMTEMCTPPCIVVGHILFQPMYLLRMVNHSNAQAHFVILDFGNNRSLWIKNRRKEKHTILFSALLQALGPQF